MERLANFSYTILFCGILAVVPVFYFLGIGVQSPAAFKEFDQRPRSQPAALAWDRIHPGPAGHMIIARAFLESFGCIPSSPDCFLRSGDQAGI